MFLWIKVSFSLLATVLLLGCSSSKIIYVDPELRDWFSAFEAEIGVSTVKVSGYLSNSSDYGSCFMESQTVVINKQVWGTATDLEKEFLVFHELGHCAAMLPHDSSIKNGCEVSIMNPVAFWNSPCYYERREELFQELRDKVK